MRRTRGLIELVFDLVDETSALVKRTQIASGERWIRRFAPPKTAELLTGTQETISGGVFSSIRIVNGIIRFSVSGAADLLETALDQIYDSSELDLATPVRSTESGTATWYLDHLQSLLNGICGDYLSTRNPHLDLGMTVRHHGRHLPANRRAFAATFPKPTNKICVFVHGLATTEWLWSRSAEEHYDEPDVTFGSRLLADADFTPVYVRYNSGLRVSENGRALAALLTDLCAAYPTQIAEIALVGHSMGGLVARSAAHTANEGHEPWVDKLRDVICIGSPHLGAPLEKTASLVGRVLGHFETAATQVTAELVNSRSSGIKDLRYGDTSDGNRMGTPHVAGVEYHFLAATISRDPDHPLGRLLGDLLVRVPSASGEAAETSPELEPATRTVFYGLNHMDIASHPEVYGRLRELLAT